MSCRDLVLQTLMEGTELLLHAGLLEPLELFAFKSFSENKRMKHQMQLEPSTQLENCFTVAHCLIFIAFDLKKHNPT